MPTPPPPEVIEAFGETAPARLMDGGQGRTWRAGGIVLKPVALEAESRWRAATLDDLPESDAFRTPRPVRAATGDWIHGGWEACRHMAGRTDPRRWNDAIETGATLHAAIAHLERPQFLDDRDDWWSRADRAAWAPSTIDDDPLVRGLLEARRPLTASEQLVHGDLLGNVLYEPGLPPAVIDWPPYWRPPAWAAAVAAVDALCWHRAEPPLLDRWSHLREWPQVLVRALLFRILTDREAARSRTSPWEPHPAYGPVAELVLARVDT